MSIPDITEATASDITALSKLPPTCVLIKVKTWKSLNNETFVYEETDVKTKWERAIPNAVFNIGAPYTLALDLLTVGIDHVFPLVALRREEPSTVLHPRVIFWNKRHNTYCLTKIILPPMALPSPYGAVGLLQAFNQVLIEKYLTLSSSVQARLVIG